MHYYKLTIAYDGTEFRGWQQQPNHPTIQGTLVEILEQLTQERIMLFGAGRTDAGVHALGQVASFRTQSGLTAEEFQRGMNALLPAAIRIVAMEETGPDFNARWQARGKIYRYRIHRGRIISPFEYRYALHHPWPLDEAAMSEAARHFEGTHDFTSFAASAEDDEERPKGKASPEREIFSTRIYRGPGIAALFACSDDDKARTGKSVTAEEGEAGEADVLVFEIRGRSFLRYMVRKIAGTLVEVGRGKLVPDDIPRIFEARDRSQSGPTLAPHGLFLVRVEYEEPWK